MYKPTQLELISESFWSAFKKPFKVAGGVIGATIRGGAKALDYVAPELTQPLHSLEAGVRDIGRSARTGYDAGSGGLMKVYKDKLLDAGYLMDENKGITKSGINKIVIGYSIAGHDKNGPIGDTKKPLSFIFDKDNNFKIVKTSAQDRTKFGQTKKKKNKTP